MENKPYIKVKKNNETVGLVQTPLDNSAIVGIKERRYGILSYTKGKYWADLTVGITELYIHKITYSFISSSKWQPFTVSIICDMDYEFTDAMEFCELVDGKSVCLYSNQDDTKALAILTDNNMDFTLTELTYTTEISGGFDYQFSDITNQIDWDSITDEVYTYTAGQ